MKSTLTIKDLTMNQELNAKTMAAVSAGYVNKAWNSWYGDQTGQDAGPIVNLGRGLDTIVT